MQYLSLHFVVCRHPLKLPLTHFRWVVFLKLLLESSLYVYLRNFSQVCKLFVRPSSKIHAQWIIKLNLFKFISKDTGTQCVSGRDKCMCSSLHALLWTRAILFDPLFFCLVWCGAIRACRVKGAGCQWTRAMSNLIS